MKTFKEFLSEAKQIKIGDKVKSKNTFASTGNISGKVVDIKNVKFSSGDETRYIVQKSDGSKIELTAGDIIKESAQINESHFSDGEMKKIKKHYADNTSMQNMLTRYETAEKQDNMKKAGEIAKGIKKIAKDDMVIK